VGKIAKMRFALKFVFNVFLINLASLSLTYAQDSQNPATNQITKFEVTQEIPDIELGNPHAEVKVIEYSALNCTHCARFHKEFFPQLKSKYIDTGQIKFIYRYFPIDLASVHAMAVIIALPQEKWFSAITKAYENQGKWMGQDLNKLAKLCGVPFETYQNNLHDQKRLDSIIAKRFNAEQRITIDATPTFHIFSPKGDILINTPITDAELEKKIASLL
jgi:protein-disulfide isomerase